MFRDTNWKIRIVGAKQIGNIVSKLNTNTISDYFYSEMKELLFDEEIFVRLEAFKSFIEIKF